MKVHGFRTREALTHKPRRLRRHSKSYEQQNQQIENAHMPTKFWFSRKKRVSSRHLAAWMRDEWCSLVVVACCSTAPGEPGTSVRRALVTSLVGSCVQGYAIYVSSSAALGHVQPPGLGVLPLKALLGLVVPCRALWTMRWRPWWSSALHWPYDRTCWHQCAHGRFIEAHRRSCVYTHLEFLAPLEQAFQGCQRRWCAVCRQPVHERLRENRRIRSVWRSSRAGRLVEGHRCAAVLHYVVLLSLEDWAAFY